MCSFILKKIIEFRDDQGNLTLIDFLKSLLKGINEGLGGINDLDVFIDETNNQIKIIDKNPLPYEDKVIEKIEATKSNGENSHGYQSFNQGKACHRASIG